MLIDLRSRLIIPVFVSRKNIRKKDEEAKSLENDNLSLTGDIKGL